jgi:hypothetical protein
METECLYEVGIDIYPTWTKTANRCRIVVVSSSYYIYYGLVMTLFRQHVGNPRPTFHPFLRFSFNHDPTVLFDLRFPLLTLSFRDVPRQIASSRLNPLRMRTPTTLHGFIHQRIPMEHRRIRHKSHKCKPWGPLPSHLDVSSDADPASRLLERRDERHG